MADDPFYQALGTRPIVADARPTRRRLMVAGIVALLALGLAGFAVLRQDRRPIDSVAIAPIEPLAPTAPAVGVASGAPPAAPATGDAAAAGPTVQPNGDTVEFQHGVKIIRLGGASLSKTIAVPGDRPASGATMPVVTTPSRSTPVP